MELYACKNNGHEININFIENLKLALTEINYRKFEKNRLLKIRLWIIKNGVTCINIIHSVQYRAPYQIGNTFIPISNRIIDISCRSLIRIKCHFSIRINCRYHLSVWKWNLPFSWVNTRIIKWQKYQINAYFLPESVVWQIKMCFSFSAHNANQRRLWRKDFNEQ